LVLWTPTAEQAGNNPVVLRVSDGRGGVTEKSFSIVVGTVRVNHAPSVVSNPLTSVTVGGDYQYDTRADDPDSDSVVWNLVNAPDGMSVDPNSGAVRWTPTAAHVGTHSVTVRAADGQGGTATQSFTVTVLGVNRPPQIVSAPSTTATVGSSFVYPVRTSDPDGDAITFSVAGPSGMTIDPATGLIRWIPTPAAVAIHEITIVVSDGLVTTAQTFDLDASAAAV